MGEIVAPRSSWMAVAGAYFGLLIAFALVALYRISVARDPFIGNLRIPSSVAFQVFCALAAGFSGIGALWSCGLVMDKGTTKQMLALVPMLPLVLILLDALLILGGGR